MNKLKNRMVIFKGIRYPGLFLKTGRYLKVPQENLRYRYESENTCLQKYTVNS